MQIEHEIKLDYDDVLIRPKWSSQSSRQDAELKRKFTTLHSKIVWEGIPIVAANMSAVGTFAMAKVLSKFGMPTALHKHYTVDQYSQFTQEIEHDRYFYTMGSTDSDFGKLHDVISKCGGICPRMINLDVANGYTKLFHKKLQNLRLFAPTSIIMAGNVATPEMTLRLLESGADIVKIGIGPGSCCTTRIKTGVGYPQLSAIIECADAAHGYGGLICADGGCKVAGDVAKAFGAGADFVMLGGMFAGTDECEGEWEYETIDFSSSPPVVMINSKVKKNFVFFGMASKLAQEKYNGGLADYRSAEGKSVKIPAKGPVEEIVKDILGGLRSTCLMVGAKNLKSLSKCCTFIRCTNTHNRVFDIYNL